MVNLVSGGLDSTLIGVLARESGMRVHPLFVDYGQRASEIEWRACKTVHAQLKLPKPARMDVSGFGHLIHSGLTNAGLDAVEDAFTPGRNLLFLLIGSAYAYQLGATTLAIGLLSEEFALFPDQRLDFIAESERTIRIALGRQIRIVTPLIEFSKADVVRLAREKGITGTYSCHVGGTDPCGYCIACREYLTEAPD